MCYHVYMSTNKEGNMSIKLSEAMEAYWDLKNELDDIELEANELDQYDPQEYGFSGIVCSLKKLHRKCDKVRGNIDKSKSPFEDLEYLGYVQGDIETAISEYEWIDNNLRYERRDYL